MSPLYSRKRKEEMHSLEVIYSLPYKTKNHFLTHFKKTLISAKRTRTKFIYYHDKVTLNFGTYWKGNMTLNFGLMEHINLITLGVYIVHTTYRAPK